MSSLGKLIVIEGLDGSGKETQSNLLEKRLLQEKVTARRISFPDYASRSSALVQMYLGGELGGLDEVNVYAASSFYAVDRYASYQTDWKQDYLDGVTLVCDRYATSNAIYQMAKLNDTQWEDYLVWSEDYEYQRFGLPQPSLVLYLDMPPEYSERLLLKRYEGNLSKKDLHEASLSYQQRCRQAALYTANLRNWKIISCADSNNQLRSIAEISENIWEVCNK